MVSASEDFCPGSTSPTQCGDLFQLDSNTGHITLLTEVPSNNIDGELLIQVNSTVLPIGGRIQGYFHPPYFLN